MSSHRKVKSALISVFNKDNLAPVIEYLATREVTLYSTGGTQNFIEELGFDVVPVEELTSYPSILGGRVKTLHPKIFGGILGRRSFENDLAEMQEFQIPEIDLVIVDLYPFTETLKGGGTHQEIIEKIDIGGISLIRAAAKNYSDVMIVSDRTQYAALLEILKNGDCGTDEADRQLFAAAAFRNSSAYDKAIGGYFASRTGYTGSQVIDVSEGQTLRYGENPHQKAHFSGDLNALFEQIQGKELSYNNLLDLDAAVRLIDEFDAHTPALAILKHNNACGVAVRPTLLQAWKDALSSDPVSAFGGVIIANQAIDVATATEINELFFEILLAPGYEAGALDILSAKKNRIILKRKPCELLTRSVRSVLNGYLVQDNDLVTDLAHHFQMVTERKPTEAQIADLVFANKICKHTKSNAIILAKDGMLLAGGTGQTSRVDALQQAIHKAKSFGFSLQDAVMASDAFFPFPDCVEIAGKEGINAIVQPGGSIKDQLSIDYCNQNNLAMVMTGNRHFKH
ncbi:MAG TPA: bifunctional phosphoribosylaminoimidazolecarboxamide formyltransferase/IMP cyclohydrolase [Luteibaculaceae bacterium]|nr:bifunctional phosphoribosylaminoimidazolecarboxamide formyltransferase/IMP cyclohydrolase [Luteibaculaceae bacterium]